MRKRVASLISWRIVASGLQALTLIFLARGLGPGEFGIFAASIAAAAFAAVGSGLGGTSMALRAAGQQNPEREVANLLVLRLITLPVVAVVASICCLILGADVGATFVFATFSYGVAEALGELVEAVLLGMQTQKRANVSLVGRRGLTALLLGYGFLDLSASPATLLLIASGLSILWSLVVVRPLIRRPRDLRITIHQAREFWLATVVGKLELLDTVVAAIVAVPLQAGLYAGSSRVTSPLNLVTGATLGVYTPQLAKAETRERRQATLRDARRFLTIVAAFLLLMSPLVGIVVELVLGHQYKGVAVPATLLTIAVAFGAFGQPFIAYFFSISNARVVTRARLAAVPLGLIAMGVLGYYLGAVGVAIGVCVLQSGQATLLWISYKRHG